LTNPQDRELTDGTMSEATAILIAAGLATAGYLLNHALGRWAERRRAEEAAVTELTTATLSLIGISQLRRNFAEGRSWRQLLPGSPPAMPDVLALQVIELFHARTNEAARAHGHLIQHARASLVDAADEVFDAAAALADAWEKPADTAALDAAEHELGQARLRLHRLSRGRRSAGWRLGRPALFNNIHDEHPAAATARSQHEPTPDKA
jgi:hypothetical protein